MFSLGSCFRRLTKPLLSIRRHFQICVIGGANPVGQSLSLLLKEHPLIHRLTMFDAPAETFGNAMDLSHIPRESHVEGWTGRLDLALRYSDIVVIACGNPKLISQSNYELFCQNAQAVISSAHEIAAHCPNAFIVVATEPINHTVPLACKVLQSCDAYNKRKILGVTGEALMRTQSWVSNIYGVWPHLVKVPVVCGHSSETILPLFSHITPPFKIDKRTASMLTGIIRSMEYRILNYKGGCGFSNLTTSYAAFETVKTILNAMNGLAVEHCAFIANNDYGTKFFATPIILTSDGISAVRKYKLITELEATFMYTSTEHLALDVYEAESLYNPAWYYPIQVKGNMGL